MTDGSDAGPGEIGEFISASVQNPNAVPVTSAAALDIVTIDLSAGDWDVQGQVATQAADSGQIQSMQVWTSTVSKTRPTELVGGYHEVGGVSANGSEQMALPTGRMRLVLTAPATVYLSAVVVFTNTLTALGFLGARRIR